MKITKKNVKTVSELAMARAKVAGKTAASRVVEATDSMLVAAGKAAKHRQRARAVKAGMKIAARAALIAGTAVATVAAVRAIRARKPAV